MKLASAKTEDIATAEKDGFFTGRYAVNPFSGEKIPIWVGNFVLLEYGTGAIMAVPAHDERDNEFALKFGLPVPVVVEAVDSLQPTADGKTKKPQDPPFAEGAKGRPPGIGEVGVVGEKSSAGRQDGGATSEKEKALLRKAHQTLRRVTADFETRWHFNSAIAQIMELVNAMYAAEPLQDGVRPEVQREVLELVTLMLAPMTPHLSEELWEMLGHAGGLWTVSWPAFNADLAKDEEVEIPVQVNGKVRGKVKVAAGASEAVVLELARGEAGIAGHLAGKTVRKVIFVADRMLNLVVG
jgi:leucyl-tRNA synthetase